MDTSETSMRNNIAKNTGKTLEQWMVVLQKKSFAKHGEIIKFLKEEHAFTHGFANFVALKSRGTDAGSAKDTAELIEKQYKGKEQFIPLYHKLLSEIMKFGNDIQVLPKNAYVSLKRKTQFAILQPATKIRFEIGLSIKGQEATGVLESISTPNAMCTHKINLATEKDITK